MCVWGGRVSFEHERVVEEELIYRRSYRNLSFICLTLPDVFPFVDLLRSGGGSVDRQLILTSLAK